MKLSKWTSNPWSLEIEQETALAYCPNADVSLWIRRIVKWLPIFWVLVFGFFVIGSISGYLTPFLWFMGRSLLLPFKPVLVDSGKHTLDLIRILQLSSWPVFLGVGAFVAYFTAREGTRPTHILLKDKSFCTARLITTKDGTYGWSTYSILQHWDQISRIKLVRPEVKRSNLDYVIRIETFAYLSKPLDIRYGDIINPQDRIRFMETLRRNVRQEVFDPELLEVFSSPEVRQSYTEIWLRELSAPPKRDKLAPLETGAVLKDGEYSIRTRLGVGGQGTVYLADRKQYSSTEVVALKEFILPVFPDPRVRMKAAERFQTEAAMLSKLLHPQIVKFIDLFVEDHRAYLVLEHVEGRNLKDTVLKSGRLSESLTIELALQMCDLLEFLHGQDPPVAHRDFTPDNLMLSSDGKLKLIDFSVAQKLEEQVTGSVVGKPNYISPEQFRGKPVPQSDIYSLGASLYFLLVGEDPPAIKKLDLNKDGVAKSIAVSEALNSIIARATELSTDARYQSVADLRSDLLDINTIDLKPVSQRESIQ